MLCIDSSSDSDSILSTTSSSGLSNNGKSHQTKQQWETFNDRDSQDQLIQPGLLSERPPIPPPRSELELLEHTDSYENLRNKSNTPVDLPVNSPSPENTNPFSKFETESDDVILESGSKPFNSSLFESRDNGLRQASPFESLHLNHPDRPTSPFADFSSSIAKALLDKLDPDEDPQATHPIVNTSHDLCKSDEEVDDLIMVNRSFEVDTPTQPTQYSAPILSEGVATQNAMMGEQKRTSKTDLKSNSSASSKFNSIHISNSSPAFLPTRIPLNHSHTLLGSTSSPVYVQGYQNSLYETRERRPSGPRSPNFPQVIPLTFNSRGFPSKKPPPRPQPYSGDQATQLREQLQKRPTTNNPSPDPMLQRLPSLGSFNPFKDLIGEGGMEEYVSKQGSNRSSPLV